MRKRLVNFRPLLFVFVGMLLGIFFVDGLLGGNTLKLIAILVVFGGIVCVAMLYTKRATNNLVKGLLIFTLSFVMAISFMFGLVGKALKKIDEFGYDGSVITISGRVASENESQVLLKNIEHNGKEYKDIKIVLYAGVNQNFNYEIGTILTCNVKLTAQKLVNKNGLSTKVLLSNIYFSGYISSVVKVEETSTTLFEKIKLKTDKLLLENMDKDASGICKALLWGDKLDIESEVYEAYRLSGLAHILSISGLHVGFIVMLISYILKKCKVHPIVQIVVLGIFLTFYCLLCGLASAVVRASIMSLTLELATLIVRRKDRLTNICLAGIVVLMVSPAYALDVGFQLSFLAVVGIMLFCTPITNALNRIKLPNFLSSTFAVTLSAELTTFPVIVKCFGYFSPISFIANLVILPIFTFVFCVLFLVMWFNLIFSIGGLYFVLGKAVSSLNSLTKILSQVGVINLSSLGTIGSTIYYSAICINSKYISASKLIKTLSIIILLLAFAYTILF